MPAPSNDPQLEAEVRTWLDSVADEILTCTATPLEAASLRVDATGNVVFALYGKLANGREKKVHNADRRRAA